MIYIWYQESNTVTKICVYPLVVSCTIRLVGNVSSHQGLQGDPVLKTTCKHTNASGIKRQPYTAPSSQQVQRMLQARMDSRMFDGPQNKTLQRNGISSDPVSGDDRTVTQ